MLSHNTRMYYSLLRVIADDKTYVNFKSDSLINAIVHYYSKRNNNEKTIRALVYQGIVRTRMGISDSTVYEPLKKAYLLYASIPSKPQLGYFINYFLGNIHFNNRNLDVANNYFKKSLTFARQERDSIHIFDSFLALFWNEMMQMNYEKSKIYLDSISDFYLEHSPEKDYSILNAKSTFYDTQGEYVKALSCEKELLRLVSMQSEQKDLSKLYFTLSDRYNSLNQMDSAMYNALKAVEFNEDTDGIQTYLLYQNVAEIAEKKFDYSTANSYRKQSFDLYEQSVEKRLDTQVMELEKKYDLSEAENETLRTRENLLITIIIIILLLIAIVGLTLLNISRRKKGRMKILLAEHEIQKKDLQTSILLHEANKQKWLIELYNFISGHLMSFQERFTVLSQRYISSKPEIYDEMKKIITTTEKELRESPSQLLPDDTSFSKFTGIDDRAHLLNDNDKLILMLLACNADNRQIATFLNTSIESVRSRKSQLKKKLTENNYKNNFFV